MEFDRDLDVKGLNCPLPILRTKKALAEMETGQVLRVQATDPGSVKDFAAFAKQTGNELLEQKEENCKMLRVNNPILTNTDLLKIKNMKVDGFKVAEIPITYYKNTSLEKAIEYLFIEVDRVIREGANILISDRP